MEELTGAIFVVLGTDLLGYMSVFLVVIYLYRYFFAISVPGCPTKKPIYAVRAFYWTIFAIGLFIFGHMPIDAGRAILRFCLATTIFSELIYNFTLVHLSGTRIHGHIDVARMMAGAIRRRISSWTRN